MEIPLSETSERQEFKQELKDGDKVRALLVGWQPNYGEMERIDKEAPIGSTNQDKMDYATFEEGVDAIFVVTDKYIHPNSEETIPLVEYDLSGNNYRFTFPKGRYGLRLFYKIKAKDLSTRTGKDGGLVANTEVIAKPLTPKDGKANRTIGITKLPSKIGGFDFDWNSCEPLQRFNWWKRIIACRMKIGKPIYYKINERGNMEINFDDIYTPMVGDVIEGFVGFFTSEKGNTTGYIKPYHKVGDKYNSINWNLGFIGTSEEQSKIIAKSLYAETEYKAKSAPNPDKEPAPF